MSPRYAIYYAPEAASALWIKAAAWLGRDAYIGRATPRPELPALSDLDAEALTADPRHYGFHATLKAPFELAGGHSVDDLLAAARAFAARMTPFTATIAPAALGRFLAFRLQAGEAQMQALHAACVRDFEPFRAPLSDDDLARRRRGPLTTRQDERLVEFGYPYLFEDFRFHMTLTGAIADDVIRTRVLAALKVHFAPETGPHRFDAIAVFRQSDRDAPFDIVERTVFAASVSA
jgi:putative phosphonate metabolism protein